MTTLNPSDPLSSARSPAKTIIAGTPKSLYSPDSQTITAEAKAAYPSTTGARWHSVCAAQAKTP